jgi:hypothetical protein
MFTYNNNDTTNGGNYYLQSQSLTIVISDGLNPFEQNNSSAVRIP